MNESTITQTVLFSDLVDRPLTATFDQPHASSDGGAILLKAADRHVGLLAALTATVPDARAPARVTHGVGDLVAQRVFAIACGHPDGNDGDRLADDPIHKLLLGRDPIEGGRLAALRHYDFALSGASASHARHARPAVSGAQTRAI